MITKKQLRKIRTNLGHGGYALIAQELNCSSSWPGQVLRDVQKANKYNTVVETALAIIKKKRENSSEVEQLIEEVIS